MRFFKSESRKGQILLLILKKNTFHKLKAFSYGSVLQESFDF